MVGPLEHCRMNHEVNPFEKCIQLILKLNSVYPTSDKSQTLHSPANWKFTRKIHKIKNFSFLTLNLINLMKFYNLQLHVVHIEKKKIAGKKCKWNSMNAHRFNRDFQFTLCVCLCFAINKFWGWFFVKKTFISSEFECSVFVSGLHRLN